jgi:hypothetical protein
MRIWIGRLSLLLGAVLLAVSIAGLFQRPAERRQSHYRWDRLDLALDRRTQDYPSLLGYARARMSGTEERKALALLDIVSRRFVHGLSNESFLTSYLQFLGGPALRAAYSRDRILRLGNEGFCSQQSYVLVQLANDLGIRARQVGLNGHVVAELWFDGDWHMLDPDYEVAIRDSRGRIASVAELERDGPRLMASYGPRAPAVAGFFESREDNSFATYPPGSYFVWKAQVLLFVTEALLLLRWVIPFILFAVGWTLLSRPSASPR